MSGATGTALHEPKDERPAPFKGLEPFTAGDEGLFFARNDDRDVVIANLRAHRLTLLYGESGVGKTSLLLAGVMPELERRAAKAGALGFAAVHFETWTGEVAAALATAIDGQVEGGGTLHARATERARRAGLLLVVLDQFEEYFLYHPADESETGFAAQFAAIVDDRTCPVHFLVSLREDALGRLDRFEARIPRLFSHYLRVERLNEHQGREAIVRPLEKDGRATADPELVDAVLKEVLVDSPVPDADEGIEAAYLQLVMRRLWDEDMRTGALRLSTLKRLGGADGIVGGHLERAMSDFDEGQQALADQIFRQLVTPSGAKIAYTPTDLAEYMERPHDRVEELLRRLAGETRILRAVATPGRPDEVRYEIYHDKLAPAVLAWRRQRGLRAAESRARARRRWTRVLVIVGAWAVIVVLASVVALLVTDAGREVRQFYTVLLPAALAFVALIAAALTLFEFRR